MASIIPCTTQQPRQQEYFNVSDLTFKKMDPQASGVIGYPVDATPVATKRSNYGHTYVDPPNQSVFVKGHRCAGYGGPTCIGYL